MVADSVSVGQQRMSPNPSGEKNAKKIKKRLPPAQLWVFLRDEDATRNWPPGHVRAEKRRLLRTLDQVRGEPQTHYADPAEWGGYRGGLACSSTRFDDYWHRSVSYQPGGMLQCKGCNAFVPTSYIGSSGHCLDCRFAALPEHLAYTIQGSTSSVSMARIRRARSTGEEKTPGGF